MIEAAAELVVIAEEEPEGEERGAGGNRQFNCFEPRRPGMGPGT